MQKYTAFDNDGNQLLVDGVLVSCTNPLCGNFNVEIEVGDDPYGYAICGGIAPGEPDPATGVAKYKMCNTLLRVGSEINFEMPEVYTDAEV